MSTDYPLAQPEPQGPISEAELEDGWNQQADQFNQWDSLSLGEQLAWAQARALARWGRPAIEPVAWCSSQDFQDAALKRQSFNGWRERHPDCDLALYAHAHPEPQGLQS
jgi:hypothetical protein